jgi:hypothetical protein
MIGMQDLTMVHRHQEKLRRDAARDRLASRINRQEPRQATTRRVLGLRISFA